MDIKLTSLELREIFLLLSKAFGSRYEVVHAEYSLKIPKTFGSGTIIGIHYPNGVGFIRMDVTFNQEVRLIYSSHQVHPLRFIYSLNNHMIHKFNDEDTDHLIEEYQSAIIASKYPYGHTFTIPKGENTTIAFLEIDRKIFIEQLSEEAHDMSPIFYEMFFDVFATRTFFHKGLYSLQVAQLIKEIAEFEHSDFVRTNFIGAKALEILSFMLLQYEDDLRDEGMGRILRKSEISAIYEVSNYIDNNLINLPSVENLAKQIGLSPAKLQEGFQLLHKCSVNEYIINKRLDTAFRLLSDTDSQIGEVVLDVGLSSRSYFSKIFKEKYKVSPIDVKRGSRSKKG